MSASLGQLNPLFSDLSASDTLPASRLPRSGAVAASVPGSSGNMLLYISGFMTTYYSLATAAAASRLAAAMREAVRVEAARAAVTAGVRVEEREAATAGVMEAAEASE